jgi:hypothetical protein
MTSPYRIERDRGTKEYRHQFAVLREKWPLAFPVKDQDVRPLAIGATGELRRTRWLIVDGSTPIFRAMWACEWPLCKSA